MKKQLLPAALTLALALVAVPSVFAQTQYNSCVENEGADIAVTLPTSFTTANTKLPDPFKKIDGTRISTKEAWKTRRQEILKLAERTVYGTKPGKPANVSGTVSNSSITVNIGSSKFTVSVSLPSTGSKPYPAVIRYGNSGADDATMKALGVAIINYTPTDVGGETGSSRSKSGVFYTVNSGSPYNKTGTLAAWAWGVSRIIDVIEADPNKLIDPTRIGVTGCSRYGKGPFAAGALDQRIALTMPMEGGTGGAAIMRGAAKESGAQSPSNAYGEQPWLGDDFKDFNGTSTVNNLPIDMHEVVGLIAPRGLLILEKPSAADWLASRSGHMSALAGSKVYEALGYGGNITYHSNNNNGSHCAWITEWKPLVEDNVKRFLLRTQAPPAAPTINPRSDRTFATADWIDWTAPTLSGTWALAGGCGSTPSTPTPSAFTLTTTVNPANSGTITPSPAKPASGKYDSATVVKLTAAPAAGYVFDGWDGDATGTKDTVSVVMNKNMSVTAKFKQSSTGIARGAAAATKIYKMSVATLSNNALIVNFVAAGSGQTAVKLYNLRGDALSTATLRTVAGNSYTHTIDAVNLPDGFYVVGIVGEKGAEHTRVAVYK
ncbi:endo-1,4-beta-xylanase [Fibrobacteres bacterium R8-0-B4]